MQKKRGCFWRVMLGVMISLMQAACVNAQGLNLPRQDLLSYETLTPKLIKQTKGTLIMSDSPEVVKAEGILYKASAKENGRLLFHHLNETTANKRFVIIAENKSDQKQILTVNQSSIEGPAYHILHTGERVLTNYLQNKQTKYYFFAPREKQLLIDTSPLKWQPHQVVSGMLDFQVQEEMRFTALASHEGETIGEMLQKPYLKRDKEPRGTFEHLDYTYRIHLDKQGAFKWGIGEQQDEFEKGIDSVTGEEVINYGNYGVLYHLKIKTDYKTLILINPRGGVFKGAVALDEHTPQIIERSHFFKHEQEVVPIYCLEAGSEHILHYMLPNGSAAPVYIGFLTMAPEEE